ncbi:RMD1 family protein [Flavisolibacter nicotianae]|uniref:RMD1 family protein n=1 Tax=Flavisolibacter nicotianae TaxID=2364882 RepID=UPI000EB5AF0F|nr:RMD1 family protein [Flavisolibacter nicotianae]
MTQKVISYQIADSIDVKQFSAFFKAELYYSDPSELFYRIDTDHYLYVFKYGAVCFLNYDPVSISEFLRIIKPFCKNIFENSLTDEFLVETGSKDLRVGFNKIEIPSASIDVLRLVMINVSQSVALDYYGEQTSKLLAETNQYTQMLETKGRLGITGKKLKQYIGRTLLLRNRIAENIYVFDSPPETWENERLNKADSDLKRTFDLQVRVRVIHEGLSIVRDNLELFRGLLQYRNSNILEWIVIILILVEVLNIAIEKLF